MAKTKTTTEFRIETLKPGQRKWRYRHFTGAGSHKTRDNADRHLERAALAAPPGWKFRVASRRVTITTTEWEPIT